MGVRARTAAVAMAAVGAAALTGASGVAAKADPSRATAAEKRAIERAVRTSPLGGLRAVSPKVNVTGIRISVLSRHWAFASATPKKRYQRTLQGGGVVLVRTGEVGRPGPWAVVAVGTGEIGCEVAPARVMRSFGFGCPPGERL